MRMIASAAALLVGLLFAGCNGEVVGGGQRPAAVLVVSGDLQTGIVGQELPQPLVVKVVDDAGEPVPNQLVNFRVVSGGGSVFAGSAITNRDGIAQERWTLGTVAGDTQVVEARAVDTRTGAPIVFATFRAIARPDAPAAIAARAPAARSGSAGEPLADSLEALVTDTYGNPVSGVPVAWTVPAGGGTISPMMTTTGADGIARAQWTLGLDISVQQTAEAAISPAVRAAFTATAGLPMAATLAKVSGDAQGGTVGATLPQPLTVELRTSLGQPVAGAQVTWTPAAFSGAVTPPVSVTGPDGRASTTWTLATRPGMQQATASVPGAANVAFTATAAAGPAATVTVVPPTLTLTALGDSARLAATALDAYGNAAAEPVQWSSRNPAVATVDAAGQVTARGNGSTGIVATAGERADTSLVTVTQQAVRLDLTPRADTLNALGDTIRFTGRLVDRNGQPVAGTITWSATNPLRPITPGVFVSRTNGLATVTASGGGFTQTATVLARQVPATLTVRSGTLIVNDTVPINPARARELAIAVEVRDSNDARVDVVDRPAATLSPTGAIAAGNQAIIAAAPGAGTATIQMGSATATSQHTVIAFDSVAADDAHGCGLTTGGDVYCWGAGFNQALPSPAGRPRKVSLPGRAKAIASDCALLENGTVYCGLAGTPAAWTGLPAFASLTEGCALTAAGTAYCKDADGVVRPLPGYSFVQVAQRVDYAPNAPPLERCGLQANGQVVCWTPGGTPAPLAGGHTFRQIDVGRWMSCGITTDGRLLCWGYLYGDGAPVLVSASLGLVTLEVEYANACGLRADGALFCWGSNEIIEGDPGVAVPPAPKFPALRFTDYSVGMAGYTSVTGMAALECGITRGSLWCSGGDLRSNIGRTGGPGLVGYVMSPF